MLFEVVVRICSRLLPLARAEDGLGWT